MKNTIRIIVAIALIIVGVMIFANKPVKEHYLQEINNDTKQELKELTPEKIKENEEVPATYNFDDVKSIDTPTVVKQKVGNKSKLPSIGEIAIPELNMNLPIVNGTSHNSMLVSAGTLKPNQIMGQGNYTLASHYSNAYNETLLFSPLKHARTGMKVYLTNGSTIYVYKITEIQTVEPTALEVLNETEYPSITLITCETVDATHRRIVKGVLEREIPSDTASSDIKSAFNIPFKTY